ncbi:acetylcholinesterase-1-like [Uloborus diversus]|uniref:acetylcholinesterase-1-like n=1 Tax=Uloborus diversus TaxID=327109 RepID=UPI002409258A|nr:acetylcholinesterase-1-like [Uloborus diversus]
MVSGIFMLILKLAFLRSAASVVLTRSGPVEGIVDTHHGTLVDTFLGIPYATPPVGQLRFRRTVPVQPWMATLKADSYAPACVQYFPYKYPWVDKMPGQSEDCLYLNIWAPRSAHSTTKKAVMFWIYGGGYSSGSNRLDTYDGSVLAAKGDVIVVNINYRLGVFGFLSTPSEEAPGNMGFYDILEALRWVKSNIQAFGGDPDNITLFGQSGGAMVSGLFCVSPLTVGLFRRVILESGAPARLIDDASYLANLQLGVRLAAEMGCAPNNASLVENPVGIIQCLRSKDANILAYAADALNNFSVQTFNFIFGDALLPINPRLAVINLQFQNVDVLIGNNQDEGAFQLPVFMPELFGPFGERNPRINKTFGSAIIPLFTPAFPAPEAAVQWYLGGLQEYDYHHVRSQVYHAYGDYSIFCPDVYFAESYARKGNSVYYYYFNHRSSVTPWAHWMGVVHADEIPFVFGRPLDCADKDEESYLGRPFDSAGHDEEPLYLERPFDYKGHDKALVRVRRPLEYVESHKKCKNTQYQHCRGHYTASEQKLSREMISMWTNFAKFGRPSHEWPTFSREKPYVLTFQLKENRKSYLQQHFENCEFFRPYFGFN